MPRQTRRLSSLQLLVAQDPCHLFALSSLVLLVGCYDVSLKDYKGGDGGRDVGAGSGMEAGTDRVGNGDASTVTSDAFDHVPDASPDAEPDGPAAEAKPDSGPDAEPDLGPDSNPDAQPDLGPDSGPNLRPDLGQDRIPDRPMGVDLGPIVLDTSMMREARLPLDMGPDLVDASLTTGGIFSLDFGSVPVGSLSSVRTFTITNVGQKRSGLLTVVVESTEFVLQSGGSGDCMSGTSTLPAGASCAVRVAYTPRTAGSSSSTINYSASPGGSGSISLSGTALSPALLTSGTTSNLFFGTSRLGTSSGVQSFAITNTGQTTSGAIYLTSTNSQFVILGGSTGDCGSNVATLTAGLSCTVRVVFTPTAIGDQSGTITFTASPGGGGSVALDGMGQCAPVCAGKCGGSDSCGGTCPDNCVSPQSCGGANIPNVCGVMGCTAASGAATWTQVPKSSPWPAPELGAIVHDTARDKFVVFGNSGTWEWDPSSSQWTDRTPTTSPPGRYYHAMAYDSARSRVVLFGGWGTGAFNDTWEWDGGVGTWSQRNPSVAPPATYEHGMAYDPVRARTVIVPGSNVFAPTTWEWDGSNWTERVASASPPPYGTKELVWDSIGQRILMVYNSGAPAVWEWHSADATWTQISVGCGPSSRGDGAAAFLPVQDKIVYLGGQCDSGTTTYCSDLWRWAPDGLGWQTYGPIGTWPSGRSSAKLVYDNTRQQLIFFGGVNDSGLLDDLWALRF